ncbi:hypothetical protein [Geobacter argillaceus]|uniref:Uncharacterized protein n=1 Tax=Geobacter argillaceus TaxID=345631 RepID=A0A562VNE6_9BACT|nr:hypothetical protein [Geobacter argillaceus]TWJ19425.1 hypothetical protein JN12_01841 [Geobacter argillaceus]
MTEIDETEERRPLGLTLLTGLYLFFFLVSASTFGNPYPYLGTIYTGFPAKMLAFTDAIICLYLFLGITKRQRLTWYLLIGYNLFQVANIIANLSLIKMADLERELGARVSQEALWTNNVAAALAILLLTQFIYRHRDDYFTNRHGYLF